MAKVLIIEDDAVARGAYAAGLTAAGHDVDQAQDGAEGILAFQRTRHAVVIVDLVMPVMNGFKTIDELFGVEPEANVIAISGASPEQLYRAEELGAAHIMVKPVEPAQLVETVGALANGQRDPSRASAMKKPTDLPLL